MTYSENRGWRFLQNLFAVLAGVFAAVATIAILAIPVHLLGWWHSAIVAVGVPALGVLAGNFAYRLAIRSTPMVSPRRRPPMRS